MVPLTLPRLKSTYLITSQVLVSTNWKASKPFSHAQCCATATLLLALSDLLHSPSHPSSISLYLQPVTSTLFLEYTGIKDDQLFQCLAQSSSSLSCLQVYSNAAGSICVGDKLLDQPHPPNHRFRWMYNTLPEPPDTRSSLQHTVRRGSLVRNVTIKAPDVNRPTPVCNMLRSNTTRQSLSFKVLQAQWC